MVVFCWPEVGRRLVHTIHTGVHIWETVEDGLLDLAIPCEWCIMHSIQVYNIANFVFISIGRMPRNCPGMGCMNISEKKISESDPTNTKLQ